MDADSKLRVPINRSGRRLGAALATRFSSAALQQPKIIAGTRLVGPASAASWGRALADRL